MAKQIDTLRENLKQALLEVAPDLKLDEVSQETLESKAQAIIAELKDKYSLLNQYLRELQDCDKHLLGEQLEWIDVIYCIDPETQTTWSVYKDHKRNIRTLVDAHNVETCKLPEGYEYVSRWRTLDFGKIISANAIVALDQWAGKPEIKVLK